MCEIDIGNLKCNTLRLLSSGTKLFITFELKVFRHEERETHNLSMLTFPFAPLTTCGPRHKLLVWPQRILKVNLLLRRQELNSLLFLKSPNPQPTFPDMTSFTSPSHIFYLGFYFDISEWHILSARAWTPVLMLYLTYPCTKRKVLILTKPKGNIYKMKSLRHYITFSVLYRGRLWIEIVPVYLLVRL